jgi:hypothetical protein
MFAISFVNTGIEFYELRKIAGLLNSITVHYVAENRNRLYWKLR